MLSQPRKPSISRPPFHQGYDANTHLTFKYMLPAAITHLTLTLLAVLSFFTLLVTAELPPLVVGTPLATPGAQRMQPTKCPWAS